MRSRLAGAAAASGLMGTLSLFPARYPAWDWAHVSNSHPTPPHPRPGQQGASVDLKCNDKRGPGL